MDKSHCTQDALGELCLQIRGVDVVLTHAERLEQCSQLLRVGEGRRVEEKVKHTFDCV